MNFVEIHDQITHDVVNAIVEGEETLHVPVSGFLKFLSTSTLTLKRLRLQNYLRTYWSSNFISQLEISDDEADNESGDEGSCLVEQTSIVEPELDEQDSDDDGNGSADNSNITLLNSDEVDQQGTVNVMDVSHIIVSTKHYTFVLLQYQAK